MTTDILIIVVLVLVILIIYHKSEDSPAVDSEPVEHMSSVPKQDKKVTIEHLDPEEKVKNLLFQRRFERMESPENNGDGPLAKALHGHSALTYI